MWLRVYVSKACSSSQLLPGAEAGMMKLQRKPQTHQQVASTWSTRNCKFCFSSPGQSRPWTIMALRSFPYRPVASGSDAQTLCSSSASNKLVFRSPAPYPRPSPHLSASSTYSYPLQNTANFSLLCGMSMTLERL